jgi:anti-sigma factor RsiW
VICFRLDIWRSLSEYESGALSPDAARNLEAHILRCTHCKEKLARLRKGQSWAKSIPQIVPQRDLWSGIEASIQRAPESRRPQRYVWAAAATLFLLLLAIFSWNQQDSNSFAASRFQQVNISNIAHNTVPHIVTEGFVTEVKVDSEDGDTLFKLVENRERHEPFVICEILQPFELKAPSVGSRVRVFGVSRYDGQQGHEWFEIHPVFKIQTLRQ